MSGSLLCAVDVSSASGWGVVVMVCLSLVSRAPVDWLADVAWRWTVQDTGFFVGTAVQICSGGYLGWKVLFGGDFSDLCVMSLRLDWRDCMAWERGWPGGLLWYPFKSGFT